MDNLILFVRERFLEEYKLSKARPIEFLDCDFVPAVSKMHPNLEKKNYRIPRKVSKYVGNVRQWFTDVEIIYCPYILHGHWVGLCIDLSAHDITVLQPDPTIYDLEELQNQLLPLAESLPFLITKSATNAEMQADLPTPFNITRYTGRWEIKRKGKFLLHHLPLTGIVRYNCCIVNYIYTTLMI